MTLTKEEAKTKWCPFVRFSPNTPTPFVFNRDDGGPLRWQERLNCIASQCMAWRVIPAKSISAGRNQNDDLVAEGWTRTDKTAEYGYVYTQPEKGYCGLAGTP